MSRVAPLLISALVAACGSEPQRQPPAEETPEQPTLTVDMALVGDWSGTLDGSFGPADIDVTLLANGRMRGDVQGSPQYCPLDAEWGLDAAGDFLVRGQDECDGTMVWMSAPHSETRLVGEWWASSGNRGTLDWTRD